MDKSFALELVPGAAFVIGSYSSGLFLGAGLAAVATAGAIWLRWRWDRSLPWLAIAIFALTFVLFLTGLAFYDATFVKVGPTVGSLAFAAIIGGGFFLRPSLLERTLGYSLQMTRRGWHVLHWLWIGLSVFRAALNELVWRNASEWAWALYNGLSDFVWLGLFFVMTWLVARVHWQETA